VAAKVADGAPPARILLVEDDDAHAELIRRALRSSQLELRHAFTLSEARAALAGSRFDLVIADLRLPDGDGSELLPGDRERAAFPVVVMTSHGDEQAAVDAMKTGAIDYVVKSEETFASMPAIAERALRSFALIAERRIAERQVRESESRLRLALDAARMGAWEWDVPRHRLTWTEKVDEILGVRTGEFGGTPDALMALVHPDDRELVGGMMAEVLAGSRGEFHFEHRIVNALGDVRWLQASGRAEPGEDGRPLRVQGTLADVTRRKRAEEALRESEERWQRLAEAAFEGIGFVENGRILDASPQLAAMLGYEPAEMIGKPVADFVAPDCRPLVAQMAGSLQAYEHQALRKDGTCFPVEVRGRAARYEGRAARVAAILDISERKRLEQRLRSAVEEWQESFDAVALGLVLIDSQRRIRRANAAALECAGRRTQEELLGKELGAIADRQPWLALLELVSATGGTPIQEVRDPASARSWLLGASPLPRGEAEPPWTILTFRDVTEIAELKEQLQRRETLAAMGTLVAGVAHEVRTPLFSISATLDAYEGHLASPTEQEQLLALLRAQVRRLSNLMSDLLEYARPARMQLGHGGVADAVRRAARSCGSLAQQAGVELREDIDPNLPDVRRDSSRLEQVVQNLLANAVQHAPAGSVVRVSARPAAAGSRAGVQLVVEDEGPGLAPEDVARVFEPLFSRRRGGIGLGLSIVQRIVEEHGGNVAASNRPGGGAAFTVFIPAAAAGEATHARA
jgi:PAS domain S-box-containing protein